MDRLGLRVLRALRRTGSSPTPPSAHLPDDEGWFYDGRLLDANMDSIAVNDFPSIWYTGALSQLLPAKFVVARKVLKDTVSISSQSGPHRHLPGQRARIVQPFNPTCDHPDSSFDSNRTTYMNRSTPSGSVWDAAREGAPRRGNYYHSTRCPGSTTPG